MNAPAVQPNSSSVPQNFLRRGFHLRRTCGTVQISGKPKQMLRIGHAADLRIVRSAPDAGAAAVHNGNRHAQPPPDLIHSANHGFLRLHREPAAPAAGAAELITLEIPDIPPPVRRVAVRCLIFSDRRVHPSSRYSRKKRPLRLGTRYAVLPEPFLLLENQAPLPRFSGR